MPKSNYQRRKEAELRKNEQGLFRRQYYQDLSDIELVNQVKRELEEAGKTATNDTALATILAFYRLNNERFKWL